MSDENYYYFTGYVTDESVARPIEWILSKNLSKENESLTHLSLIINSTGGDPYAAVALVDAMIASDIPVRTIGTGCVMSAATFIFVQGEIGKRVLTPNTRFMTHQVQLYRKGYTPTSGIQRMLDDASNLDNLATEVYFKCVNQRHLKKQMVREDVKNKLLTEEESYFTPEQVKDECGLADIIDKDYMSHIRV